MLSKFLGINGGGGYWYQFMGKEALEQAKQIESLINLLNLQGLEPFPKEYSSVFKSNIVYGISIKGSAIRYLIEKEYLKYKEGIQ